MLSITHPAGWVAPRDVRALVNLWSISTVHLYINAPSANKRTRLTRIVPEGISRNLCRDQS